MPFGEGTHTLRAILKQKFKIDPVDKGRTAAANQMLIVILGDTSQFTGWDQLRERVQEGAAVLVASDQATSPAFRSALRLRVTGEFLQVPKTSPSAYAGLADCPIVSDFEWEHPIFRTIKRIATNRPSSLERRGPSLLRPLAWFPPDTHWERQEENPNPHAREYIFAAGQTIGTGKILVLSDHSVFINDMMLQTDNDNFFFACNCVEWLSDNGKRDRVAFFEDGHMINDFNVSFREGMRAPMPSEGDVINYLNHGLAELEERDFFNRQINQAVNNQAARMSRFPVDEEDKEALGREMVLRVAVIALTIILGCLGFVRLVRSRETVDFQDPNLALTLPVRNTTESISMRRTRVLLGQDNHWETARQIARQCFGAAGVDVSEATMPHLVIATGGWWERRKLRSQVQGLWRLAFVTSPRRISSKGIRQLLEEVKKVQQALASGKVVIGSAVQGAGLAKV